MSGKWHLANDEAQRPTRRGFQRAFSLKTGGASHFADQKEIGPFDIPVYVEDGEQVEALPQDWYSSIGYADKLLEYLGEREEGAPFLAYLAFTAPHDPLQVPDDWLDRYRSAYDAGPLATRRARAKRLEELGLIPERQPERLAELLAGFHEYMNRHAVILPDEPPLDVSLRSLYPDECDWWCELRFTVIGWLN